MIENLKTKSLVILTAMITPNMFSNVTIKKVLERP